ncbi:hypothetical protein SD71_11860 [Cohnella kolymensis]|uniref:Lipoprotein n=1 Tax=Cohnella kolymensis TaxID=1590652 RepID=A0ABR5A4P1_9BACL|nr:hypothetical protein [Cohnella kolymensis]KIL36011.1 hypothetical protein SD71_11860 [Cohnella kolymensis]
MVKLCSLDAGKWGSGCEKKLVGLLGILFLLSSCSLNNTEMQEEILYHYTGEFIGLVDQRKEPVNEEYGIAYTLNMDKFYVTEPVFEKYNATYPKDFQGFRHIDFTERTKVYIRKGNTKTLISPLKLNEFAKPLPRNPNTKYQELEVWIKPYKKMDSAIEAVEVVVLQD